jgi:translocator protein
MRNPFALAVFIVVCLGVAWVSSLATRPAIGTWYPGLAKPSWTPPSWLFAPVWTALYLGMAVAGWLVWKSAGTAERHTALTLFVAQLVLNFLWSPLFFNLHRVGWAMADLTLLWAAIGGFVFTAWPVSPAAGILFLPYWLWVSYAGALNFAIWRMNPGG